MSIISAVAHLLPNLAHAPAGSRRYARRRGRAFASARPLNPRHSEWVILAFLVYAALLSVLKATPETRDLILSINPAVFAVYALTVYADSARRGRFFGIVRDWLPFPLILLAYREMGWFAVPHSAHLLELRWVTWDRALLTGGAKALIESLGRVIPSVLEIAYALVYALAPFTVAMLYVHGRRNRVDRFLFPFALAVLLCYAQFPFWPSDPPRTLFPGSLLPFDTIFRRFNLWIVGSYGIHTSVFPSAHVGAAFGAAFGIRRAMPERRWLGHSLMAMAILIAIATVYGRYHYAADAVAGFAMAWAASALTRIRFRNRASRPAVRRRRVRTSGPVSAGSRRYPR